MAQTEKKALVEKQELKPKQPVLDLETGQDVTIEFSYFRYSAKEPFTEETLKEASQLVKGNTDRTMAFLNFASAKSYQDAKNAAMAKGNYLTQELKSSIVSFMRTQAQFAELSAKDAFDKWKAGYLAKKPGAIKILELVSQPATEFEL